MIEGEIQGKWFQVQNSWVVEITEFELPGSNCTLLTKVPSEECGTPVLSCHLSEGAMLLASHIGQYHFQKDFNLLLELVLCQRSLQFIFSHDILIQSKVAFQKSDSASVQFTDWVLTNSVTNFDKSDL